MKTLLLLLLLATPCSAQFGQARDLAFWGKRKPAPPALVGDGCMTNSFLSILEFNEAAPYYVNLLITEVTNPIASVTVTISDLWHAYAADMAIVIVSPSPTNRAVKLLGNSGGYGAVGPVTITFDQAAVGYVPSGMAAGTYKPTDTEPAYVFPADAGLPTGPYETNLTYFAGLAGTNANGLWRVYVSDTRALDGGGLTNICVTITQ